MIRAPDAGGLAPATAAEVALRLLCVGVAYYLTARLGLLIPYVGTHVSLVWLPTGIATAALLRWGGAMSTSVFVAAFAVNVQIGGTPWMALGIAAGNVLGPWLSTLLLRRWHFDRALTRRIDLGLYLLAIMAGMVVTATNGTAWLHLAGLLSSQQWGPAWMTWWTGDVVGALLGGVPLLAITTATVQETFGGRRGGVNIALLGGVLVCSFVSFSTSATAALQFLLLSLPLFITAVLALRAGVLAASLSVLLLSGAAAWGTAHGVGPFASHDTHAGLLALWGYITALACTSVLICGLAAELLSIRRQQALLFKHANEGIVQVGPDGRVGGLNPAASAMLEVQESDVLDRSVAELPRGNGAALARWLAEGPPPGASHTHLSLTHADGALRRVEAQAARYCDARGLWQTQVMLRDVTERWNAQARLAASEQRLRLIADHMPALVSYIDRDYRFVFANETYAAWFGVRPENLIGKTFCECFGEASFAARRPSMDAALRSGERQTLERRSERGGRTRHLRSTYVPDMAADGSVAGLFELTLDASESKAVEEHLMQLARVDHLTGLPNRLQFEDRLSQALASARTSRSMLALAYVDVDHFKTVNDTLGHASGDSVLQEFARRLKNAVRTTDAVARLGGDEFVVLFEQVRGEEEVDLISRKIVAAMQTPIVLPEGTAMATASIGVGLLLGEAPAPSRLMATADSALYDAKHAGRNAFRIRACTPEMQDARG